MSNFHAPVSLTIMLLLVIALAAPAFAYVFTPLGGVITIGDSISYVAASRSVLAGEELARADGKPLILWPPLYPVLIAISTRIGVVFGQDLFASIQFLNYVTSR